MTMDDVVARTAMTLLTLVAAGAVAWIALPTANYGVAGIAAFAAFVVGLVVSFKRSVNPALILLYAALEGFFLGAITKVFETVWPGIAVQAVLGTAAVFAGMLIAYRSGWIKVTARYARIGMAVAVGFLLLMLVNLVASAFGGGWVWAPARWASWSASWGSAWAPSSSRSTSRPSRRRSAVAPRNGSPGGPPSG